MKAVKFNFGNDFDAQKQSQADLDALALEERLRKTQEEAFQKGQVSGRTEASEEIARELVATMDRVAEQVSALFGQRYKMEDRLERDATQLAMAMARKLAGSALEKYPHAEIEALITECMEVCREQPRIVIRLSEEQCEPMAAKIDELKQRQGFTGDVIVIGDDEIRNGDCLVEWPDGGAEHRSEHISGAIEKLVQAFIMKPPATDKATDKATDNIDPDSDAAVPQPELAAEHTDNAHEDRAEKRAEKNEAQDENAHTTEQPGAL